jgi:phage gp36-like protein
MAYLSSAQLAALMYSARLVDCTDDDGNGVADPAIVADVIERASGVMDGYFQASGLAVPLTGTAITAAVRHHVGFVAAHFAAQRKPEYRDAQGFAPYRQEYVDALAWGDKIASRKMLLEGVDVAAGGGGDEGGGMVLHAFRGQVAAPRGPRKMRGW